eukprot:PRCOL_00004397-RA
MAAARERRAPRQLGGCEPKALRRAVISAAAHSHTVMLGICAPSQDKGMASLRLWTDALGLPRGKLHGADVDGVPIEMPEGCAVFIKYHSKQGDANLSAYAGDARGVLFNATTVDNWVQCGYLPLSLLRE